MGEFGTVSDWKIHHDHGSMLTMSGLIFYGRMREKSKNIKRNSTWCNNFEDVLPETKLTSQVVFSFCLDGAVPPWVASGTFPGVDPEPQRPHGAEVCGQPHTTPGKLGRWMTCWCVTLVFGASTCFFFVELKDLEGGFLEWGYPKMFGL